MTGQNSLRDTLQAFESKQLSDSVTVTLLHNTRTEAFSR